MLNYLAALNDWVNEQQASPSSSVKLKLRAGPADRPKRSADVGFEANAALGVVAVWESGEVEAEVLAVESMARILFESTILTSEDQLRNLLARVMKAVAGFEDV